MSSYIPPFHTSDEITNLVAEISEQVGRITQLAYGNLNPHLRKANRIRSIHSSLAIEQNSLSQKQVAAILDGKRILADPKEIREVQNAGKAYEMMPTLNPYNVKDLLKAHKQMMEELIEENGRFRSGGVGIFDGEVVIRLAPPARFVSGQIKDLLSWYETSKMHPLVKSAIFHYEFEFIHPFADGNGRMGRMWHKLLLGKWKELFFWISIEDRIRVRQKEYYDAFARSDRAADSHEFVKFMLQTILDSLHSTEISLVEDCENNLSSSDL